MNVRRAQSVYEYRYIYIYIQPTASTMCNLSEGDLKDWSGTRFLDLSTWRLIYGTAKFD